MRIRVSWIFLLAVTSLVLLSTSAWETTSKSVAELLFACGIVFSGIGAMGRVWCSAYIAGYKNDALVTSGPYSLCRNPLYLFSLIGGIGVGLATETLTIPFLIAVAFAVYYPSVIRSEEATLLSLHGSSFEAYRTNVPRFFPSLRSFNELEHHAIHLKVFRRHLLSAIWFVWLPAVAELVELLHEANVLPHFWSLY